MFGDSHGHCGDDLACQEAADHGFLALVGLVVIGLGASVWAGIVPKVGGH